jgi:outer membrane lipoprotein-sorting protein
MKKSAVLLAVALMLMPLAARGMFAQAADTVQSVIDKHLAAAGGRDALMKITSRKSTGTVAISTPAGDLSGPIELYSKSPTKSRAVLELDLAAVGGPGTLTIEQIFDGVTGWSLNPMQGDQEITGAQLENMRSNFFPSPFLQKDSPDKLELLPRETVAGKEWIVMKVTRPSGGFVTIYFDPATYLVARTVTTIDNPMGGTMQQSAESQDYRTVDGIKVPFTIINSNDLQTLTIKLTKVEHNVAIDDAMFKKK